MTVYVDDMAAPYRGMLMYHMIADTKAELLAMAREIGVAARHIQKEGTAQEHFDICKAMRSKAVRLGAVEIEWRQTGAMCRRRRVTGVLGRPDDAVAWQREQVAARQAASKEAHGEG